MQVNLPIAQSRDEELGEPREMTKDDFKTIHDAVRAQSLAWLGEHGELPPTVYLPSMNEQGIARMGIMPAGDLVNHPMGKDILAMIMSRLIEDPNHDFVIFAHEAWVLLAKSDSKETVDELRAAAQGSIAEHPDRTEAVVINARSKNRQALCVMPIVRAEDGTISEIKEGEITFADENGASFEGRFAPPRRPSGSTLH